MAQNSSSVEITDAGKQLCDTVTEELFAASDTSNRASPDAWPSIAETYDFRWNLASGYRLVGGLPESYEGQPVVDGPHQYVLKIAKSTSKSTSDSVSRDLLANYIEAIIWKQAVEEGYSHLFTPVTAYGPEYHWIVMEEVDVFRRDSWNEHGPVPYTNGLRDARTRYQDLKDALAEISEDYGGEVGITRSGDVVAVDYAHIRGTKWAGMYDIKNDRRISFDDIRRRNRLENASALEALTIRILRVFNLW